MHLKSNPEPFQFIPPAVDAGGRHVPVSYWHETVDVVPGPELAEDTTADVCIVGGGFTGLSAAWFLKHLAPDLDVVIIERGVVGHGASGRNGGFAMPLIGWDLLYCVEKLGDEKARELYALMYQAVDHVKWMVREFGVQCDLEATGYLLLNTCKGRERRARRELEAAHRLGFDHEWIDKQDLGEFIQSDQFISGVFDPHPCILNPAKLARGMKTVVEGMGVRVYEQTPLVELIDGKPVEIKAARGRVKAKQVVLALNGYGASVGFL
ncbi:MAG: FAD-dependent oxidoreductase, partial [Candidatus Hydrogenedentes bacterium]|nr:FAD-dependent oxidoreductase [Candidatus Hydrogenedentota bacterium]